jgi:GNAT superfamily N-acetyltransferase
MGEYLIKKINNLPNHDLTNLIKESKEEGFRLVERLVSEYQNASNTFDKPGEALYGVFTKTNKLIAIAGLNIDPFYHSCNIGRLRRFYVLKEYRRSGVGTILLIEIIHQAKQHFETLILNTDTKEADKFYTAQGFTRDCSYQNATHYMKL